MDDKVRAKVREESLALAAAITKNKGAHSVDIPVALGSRYLPEVHIKLFDDWYMCIWHKWSPQFINNKAYTQGEIG